MTACEDDLVAELEALATRLGAEAARNSREAEGRFDGQAAIPDPGEFHALPWLTVPFRADDAGERPLPSRPGGDPPIPGFNPGVYDGEGRLVREVAGSTGYELRCRVANPGDQHVPRAKVEFFVEHRALTATVDATDGAFLAAGEADEPVTGYTTARPGDSLSLSVLVDDGGGTRQYIGDSATVRDDRTFRAGAPLDRVDPGDDATVVIHSSRLNRPLGERPVRVVGERRDNRGPLDLGAPTGAVEFVGRTTVRVSAGDATTTSVDYTTPDPASLPPDATEPYGPQQLVVYARAYTMAPIDAPNDWGVLDLRPDRHVGRTEVFWT